MIRVASGQNGHENQLTTSKFAMSYIDVGDGHQLLVTNMPARSYRKLVVQFYYT